MVYIGLTEDKW